MMYAHLALAAFVQQVRPGGGKFDALFQSLGGAFRDNASHAHDAVVALEVIVVAAVVGALAWPSIKRRRDARAEAEALARLAKERGLDAADVALLSSLAAHGKTSPYLAAKHLDVFERAVAAELETRAPTTAVREGDIFDSTHRLRERLGFGTRDRYQAILTTRELTPGLPVAVSGMRTEVAEVTEAFFALVVPRRPEVAPGVKLALDIVHQDEARYYVACALLAAEPRPEGWRLVFEHDEHPARTQRRRFVRVHAHGPATVHYGGEHGARGGPPATVRGSLIDVSVGGAAIRTDAQIEGRTHARVTFTLGAEEFHDVEATVLGCEGPPEGPFRLRIEFVRLSPDTLQKFGAAIAHASGRSVRAPPVDPTAEPADL
jgi:hypothetical protein